MTTPTLESYSTLLEAYDYFNRELFNSTLPSCLITYQRQKSIMGYVSFRRWINDKKQYVDELAINPEYFANYPTIEICQTLCHEMVHIWQAHHGNPGRRGYHNKEWARKMKSIGLIPSTTNKPGGENTGEKVGDYILAGGKFIQSCEKLLSSGFQLQWIDRYPVYREETPVIVYDGEGAAIELDLSFNDALSATRAAMLKVDQVSSNNIKSLSSTDEDTLATSEYFEEPLSSTKPTNRSNRHKYQCHHCRIQLWGKPGLNVICGDCDIPLIEIT